MRARAWLRNQLVRQRRHGAGRRSRRRLSALFPDLHDEPVTFTRAVNPDGDHPRQTQMVTPAVSRPIALPSTLDRFYSHFETDVMSSTGPVRLIRPQKGSRNACNDVVPWNRKMGATFFPATPTRRRTAFRAPDQPGGDAGNGVGGAPWSDASCKSGSVGNFTAPRQSPQSH